MDSVTHTLLGACVGEAIAGKKLGKKAMLFGAIANNFPDIDIISSLWMNQPDSLLAHRGITHSILFVILMSVFAGWLMKKIFSGINFSQQEWTMLFCINLFLHIFIDAFTAYGTGWFEPFSHYRVSFNLLFVADPFYTIALLVASIALLILKKNSSKRLAWTAAGLIISSIYIVYALVHKLEIDAIAKTSLRDKKIPAFNFLATPTPLNNFLWYIVAQNDSGYNIGYYSFFDHTKEINFHFIPRNNSMIEAKKNDDGVKKLIRFSQGYYHVEKINDTLVFSDIRFGQIGGWYTGDAPFVFQYKLTESDDNTMAIQSGRLKVFEGKAFREIIERIKGR